MIADDHKGLKAATTRVLGATTQRCRVHFMRNLLAHAGKQGRRVVSAFVATAFAQEDAEAASAQWRLVADQLRPKAPKLAAIMDEAEHDVLAYMSFPREHRQKLHSTNPIERLHAEIKRRTNVVGIFPNEDAITRLVGAVLLEQNDEWAVSRRYMTLESIAPVSDNPTVKLPALSLSASAAHRSGRDLTHWSGGLNLTVPLQNDDARRALTRARNGMRRAEMRLAERRQSIRIQVRRAVHDVAVALRQIDLSRQARDLAERKLDVERRKLQQGLSSAFQLGRFEDDLVAAQGQELDAVARYRDSLGSLDRTLGTTLDRWGISIEQVGR